MPANNVVSIAIIDSMAQLIVRNLDSRIVARLRKRAAEHGRSVEAEHREILREALLPEAGNADFKEVLLSLSDAMAGHDGLFRRVSARPRKVRL